MPGRHALKCRATQDLSGLQKAAIPVGAASNVVMLISECVLTLPHPAHLLTSTRESSSDTRLKHITPELAGWSEAHTTVCL